MPAPSSSSSIPGMTAQLTHRPWRSGGMPWRLQPVALFLTVLLVIGIPLIHGTSSHLFIDGMWAVAHVRELHGLAAPGRPQSISRPLSAPVSFPHQATLLDSTKQSKSFTAQIGTSISALRISFMNIALAISVTFTSLLTHYFSRRLHAIRHAPLEGICISGGNSILAYTGRKQTSTSSSSASAKPKADRQASTAKKSRNAARSGGHTLVIVESPAKAKTINKYLGSSYLVMSSVGHIRDLPKAGDGAKSREGTPLSAREKLFQRMGVFPEDGWRAIYQILPNKTNVVTDLRGKAEEADRVILATDRDREGEAIAWHLQEVLGGDPSRYERVVFSEITKKAIEEAFAHPREVDLNRVNAQQARRFLDRVVGFMLSPLLWAKVGRGLSAGRVQSPAVRLTVEREREIQKFIPEEFWTVSADIKCSTDVVPMEVVLQDGKKFRPTNKSDCDAALAVLQSASYKVTDRTEKKASSKPNGPFITSTLQSGASNQLGYSAKQTMTIAQKLYEAGHITYMRTDSMHVSEEALQAACQYLQDTLGEKYVTKEPVLYASSAKAQEAHEAIRPTDVTVDPDRLPLEDESIKKVYSLIWRQFLASQMPPAEFLNTTIEVTADPGKKGPTFTLRAKGRIMLFDGYLKMQPYKADDDIRIPDLQVGDKSELQQLNPKQKFTSPPARYSEATLIKELEQLGIGRPSTYASIISSIQERGYVRKEGRSLIAEKIGDIVTRRLNENFDNLMDYEFTAQLETELDKIAEGDQDFRAVLDLFYKDFIQRLDEANVGGMKHAGRVETELRCDKCGRPMLLKAAHTGLFLSCAGWNLQEKCRSTLSLSRLRTPPQNEDGTPSSLRRCGCGSPMDIYQLDQQRRFHICVDFPDCSGHDLEKGDFTEGEASVSVDIDALSSVPCHKCPGELELKNGRFGRYYACKECGATRKANADGTPAPVMMDPILMPELKCKKVDDTYVLREAKKGLFLAASQFPKKRETRRVCLDEILPHAAEFEDRFQYLMIAPVVDKEGNRTSLRWSEKHGQYLRSEKDGKLTQWYARYDAEQKLWVEGQLGDESDDSTDEAAPQASITPNNTETGLAVVATPKAKAKAKSKAKPKEAAEKVAPPKVKATAKVKAEAKAKAKAKVKAKAKRAAKA